MNRIYVAAPLFSEAEKQYNEKLKKILSDYFDVYLPQEDGMLLVDLLAKGTPQELAERDIFCKDVEAICEADYLLIVLDGRSVDEGAAFELGYAYANNKTCIALQTDPRRLLLSGNNPMLTQSISNTFTNTVDLLNWAKSITNNETRNNDENCSGFLCVPQKSRVG